MISQNVSSGVVLCIGVLSDLVGCNGKQDGPDGEWGELLLLHDSNCILCSLTGKQTQVLLQLSFTDVSTRTYSCMTFTGVLQLFGISTWDVCCITVTSVFSAFG